MYDRRSPQSPQITRRGVSATVKWYNPTKGFGFVTLSDGSPDAFLHASVVQAAGYDSLADGTSIVCDLSQGNKGPQVASIASVDESTAAAPGPRRDRPAMGDGPRGPRRGGFGGGFGGGGGGGYDAGPTETIEGTVKFFSSDKGFGFVTPDGGGKDVFVHVTALERSGVRTLMPEQRVRIQTSMGQKGPQANRVEVL
ncbi:cold-shock protein [Rhodocista pekingensis]|uniref:Cold-shock protein n=1 Tax=Rhodocista pekingensis TaxID=201185 RepID=A0ABW2KVZ2_9PROT